jgi:hypothetical protein
MNKASNSFFLKTAFFLMSIFILWGIFWTKAFSQKQEHNYEVTKIYIDTISIHKTLSPYIFRREVSYDTTQSGLETGIRSFFKIYKIGNDSLIQIITDSGSWSHKYEFIDANFDEFNDLKIDQDPEGLCTASNIWLFNPQKGLFEFSNEFSGLFGLKIDKKNKTISTEAQSTGGRGSTNAVYTIKNGHLNIVEQKISDGFYYEKDSLVAGHLQRVAHDTIIGSENNAQFTYIAKKWVLGSLRIVEKDIMMALDAEPPQNQLTKGVAVEFPWGYYRYIREEIYDFQRDSTGIIRSTKTIRRVRNGKWETISTSKKNK